MGNAEDQDGLGPPRVSQAMFALIPIHVSSAVWNLEEEKLILERDFFQISLSAFLLLPVPLLNRAPRLPPVLPSGHQLLHRILKQTIFSACMAPSETRVTLCLTFCAAEIRGLPLGSM